MVIAPTACQEFAHIRSYVIHCSSFHCQSLSPAPPLSPTPPLTSSNPSINPPPGPVLRPCKSFKPIKLRNSLSSSQFISSNQLLGRKGKPPPESNSDEFDVCSPKMGVAVPRLGNWDEAGKSGGATVDARVPFTEGNRLGCFDKEGSILESVDCILARAVSSLMPSPQSRMKCPTTLAMNTAGWYISLISFMLSPSPFKYSRSLPRSALSCSLCRVLISAMSAVAAVPTCCSPVTKTRWRE